MAVRMGVSKDSLTAPEPVEEDIYELKLEGFKPKLSNNGDSVNFNPQLRIVSGATTGTKYAGKTPLFENLNSNSGWIQNDFVHAFGFPMDELPDGSLAMPGQFDGPEDKPELWKYSGPLVGKTFKAQVIKQEYEKKDKSKGVSNKIKMYICAIPDCNTKYPKMRHSDNLVR